MRKIYVKYFDGRELYAKHLNLGRNEEGIATYEIETEEGEKIIVPRDEIGGIVPVDK